MSGEQDESPSSWNDLRSRHPELADDTPKMNATSQEVAAARKAHDDAWEQRMSDKAKRRLETERKVAGLLDRSEWPVPEWVRGYSARDAFLWYIADGWKKIFNSDDEPVVTVFDNDFGHHVLRKNDWQLTLTNLEQYPDDAWPPGHLDE